MAFPWAPGFVYSLGLLYGWHHFLVGIFFPCLWTVDLSFGLLVERFRCHWIHFLSVAFPNLQKNKAAKHASCFGLQVVCDSALALVPPLLSLQVLAGTHNASCASSEEEKGIGDSIFLYVSPGRYIGIFWENIPQAKQVLFKFCESSLGANYRSKGL